MKSSSLSLCSLALLGSLLTGCAELAPPDHPEVTIAPEPEPAAPEAAPVIVSNENIPNLPLTDEIVFKVVSAEVAFQRGDFPAAFATTIALAQQTKDPRLTKRAMEMALINKQPLQAFLAARLWHDYSPNSDEATQYYLGFMVMNNNLDEVATLVAQRLAAASPKERGLQMLQTENLVMRNTNKEAAFTMLEKLYAPYPDYIEAHLALAQAAFTSNNHVRAMVEARAAMNLNPESQLAALTLAQVSPSPDEALAALDDFVSKNPSAQETRRAYAGMLVEQKQFIRARQQFELLSSGKPQDAGISYTLGVLSLQLNDIPAAEKYLLEFVRLLEVTPAEQRDPTSAFLYLSQIADERYDGANAVDWLAKIQSYDGKNAAYFNAQQRRALLIAKYQSLSAAQQFLHELPATTNEKIQLLQLEAELLRNADQNAEAATLLQQAISNYPDNQDLLYDFAMTAEKLEHFDEMETALRQVIKLNPENQQACNALGYSLADRNIRLPEARALIEKALSLAPNDAFILDSMGWLEFREHKNETALAFLLKAYKLRPDIEIAVHASEVLWMMGDEQKAKILLKEAQQKDATNASLKTLLERLNIQL